MTALMRHGARFASRMEPQPAAILGRLNEFLRQRPGDSLCTALCAQLRESHVVLSSAGHPPAMIVSDTGEVREAPASGPLLGAFADPQWPEQAAPVDDGLILLYTDGVTELAGTHERFGVDRLRALLSEHARAQSSAAARGIGRKRSQAFSAGSQRDDIAALALRPSR